VRLGARSACGGKASCDQEYRPPHDQRAYDRCALKLRADPWEVVIRPERGGRITSLRLGGVELLDRGIGIDNPAADSFVQGGAFGWDEMVPNLEPAGGLPDHGEAWRLQWSVVDAGQAHAVMRCTGRLIPWELVRRIELSGRRLRATYVCSNRGAGPWLAYWCAHPLFRYEPGMAIAIREGERLAAVPEGQSGKIHLPKGSVDHVSLAWPGGPAIEVRWDPLLTPYVGIWACNGDLGGYRQLGVEPATGGNDRPDPAAPPPLLLPGGRFRWWLEIWSVVPPHL
jgi:hypothetical protein